MIYWSIPDILCEFGQLCELPALDALEGRLEVTQQVPGLYLGAHHQPLRIISVETCYTSDMSWLTSDTSDLRSDTWDLWSEIWHILTKTSDIWIVMTSDIWIILTYIDGIWIVMTMTSEIWHILTKTSDIWYLTSESWIMTLTLYSMVLAPQGSLTVYTSTASTLPAVAILKLYINIWNPSSFSSSCYTTYLFTIVHKSHSQYSRQLLSFLLVIARVRSPSILKTENRKWKLSASKSALKPVLPPLPCLPQHISGSPPRPY